jgi:NAD(P)-dependent dehydrogenase (short-subunit alcohol dehydrogenase family)
MEITLKNRVVWITGGGEGIGRAVALLAAQCGAKVAVTGRDLPPLKEVVKEITSKSGEAISFAADVAVPVEMQRAMEAIVKAWGQMDALVANAGINGTWAPVDELTPDDWSQTLNVNLTGSFLAVHYAVPAMKRAGGGSIVLMSSVNGTRVFSNTGATAYAVSKAGQLALGKMLALELAPAKIRVNIVCPGAFDTGIHEKTEKKDLESIETPVEFPEGSIPLTHGKMGDPEEVAKLTVFLLSDAARHITGTPVWIDGAESILQG